MSKRRKGKELSVIREKEKYDRQKWYLLGRKDVERLKMSESKRKYVQKTRKAQ